MPGAVGQDGAVLEVPRAWSDLTPAWATSALSSRLPGTVVRSAVVDPLGEGTNSRARLSLSYARGDGPPSVFVKRTGRLEHRLALAVLGAVTTEARLAASGVLLPVEHPRHYAGGVDLARLAAVVVMDDVRTAGGRPNDGTAPLTVAGVRSGLDGLARLHAAHWDRSLPTALAFLRPWHLGRVWAPVSIASLARGLRRLDRLVPGAPPTGLVGAGRLGRQFRQSAVLAATGVQTLLHGDPHPGNTYALPGDRTGFYDWQLARVGHWSHDVGYFLAGSLDPDDRRWHERDLLGGYLEALVRFGAVAPPWDEAWARYRSTPAFGLATWVHTLAFGSFQPTVTCLATIDRFAAAYEDLETGRSMAAAAGPP